MKETTLQNDRVRFSYRPDTILSIYVISVTNMYIARGSLVDLLKLFL
jgi:hypothetical protein